MHTEAEGTAGALDDGKRGGVRPNRRVHRHDRRVRSCAALELLEAGWLRFDGDDLGTRIAVGEPDGRHPDIRPGIDHDPGLRREPHRELVSIADDHLMKREHVGPACPQAERGRIVGVPNFDLAGPAPTVAERQPCCLQDAEIQSIQPEPPEHHPQVAETTSDDRAHTSKRCHGHQCRPDRTLPGETGGERRNGVR